jgi:hypothetical protein
MRASGTQRPHEKNLSQSYHRYGCAASGFLYGKLGVRRLLNRHREDDSSKGFAERVYA